MPFSANGFGTGLVRLSRKRTVNGCVQFDALEAVTAAHCPLVPYRVVHVLAIWADGGSMGEQYQRVALRPAPRLILKGFLNGWGNMLSLFGALIGAIAGLATATMERPFTATDATFLTVFVLMFVIGVACKIAWLVLDNADERVKNAIGPHDLGSSDPLYWPQDIAQEAGARLCQQEGTSNLVDAAHKASARGDLAQAALCARLAMQYRTNEPARALFEQILAMADARQIPRAATR